MSRFLIFNCEEEPVGGPLQDAMQTSEHLATSDAPSVLEATVFSVSLADAPINPRLEGVREGPLRPTVGV